jgi:hypothetical protein
LTSASSHPQFHRFLCTSRPKKRTYPTQIALHRYIFKIHLLEWIISHWQSCL